MRVLAAWILYAVLPLSAQDLARLDTAAVNAGGDSLNAETALQPQGVNYLRLGLVGGAAVGTLGASYLYLQNTWWKDEEGNTSFHFDKGADNKYALNLDKAAHFYGGHIAADMFYGALRWANMDKTSALWLGAGFGVFVQMAIEIKDGYSPRWGYSVGDVGLGSLGTLYFVAQQYSPALDNIRIKFSYWRYSDKYFTRIKSDGTGTWNDDYINQTYWASVNVEYFLPKSLKPYWPDWLAVALGVGVDETLTGVNERTGEAGGKQELWLALDVNLPALLPSDNPFWEAVKHYLNYIKFPAPAIRLSPSVVWYGVYF